MQVRDPAVTEVTEVAVSSQPSATS